MHVYEAYRRNALHTEYLRRILLSQSERCSNMLTEFKGKTTVGNALLNSHRGVPKPGCLTCDQGVLNKNIENNMVNAVSPYQN